MNIPGMPARHKIITQACRKRPIEELRSETVDELWDEYQKCADSWPIDSEVKFHFVLLVEKPKI